MGAFGEFVREMRIKNSITLREFCRNADFDPSNWSKIERGINQPPKSKDILQKIALNLNIEEGTSDFDTLFELAAIGSLPTELLSNLSVLDKLPVFFRTARGKPDREELNSLIKLLSDADSIDED